MPFFFFFPCGHTSDCHLSRPVWWHVPGCAMSPSVQHLSAPLLYGSSSEHHQVPGTILCIDLDHLIKEPCEVCPLFNTTLKMNRPSHRGYKASGQGHTGLTPKSWILTAPGNSSKKKVKSESEVAQSCLFATPWTVAYEVPLSMEFSRQEY